ncbi:MAG: hypothetical protein U1F43_32865 [Myxococcota bacterium]
MSEDITSRRRILDAWVFPWSSSAASETTSATVPKHGDTNAVW